MLEELCKFENLGTPGFHFELLEALNKSSQQCWTEEDVSSLFHNRSIDGRDIFDGCLPLLISTGIIIKDGENGLTIESSFEVFLNSESQFSDRFVEKLLISLKEDEIFHTIFSPKHISHDVIYQFVQIENAAFPLRFTTFKQLLLDFGILQPHPQTTLRRYLVNKRYKKIFDRIVLPEIKQRKMGIDELRKSLEQQQIFGEEAEKFVMDYEKRRLQPKGDNVLWVAEYSVSAGYDIASFESKDSEEHDRFIEVKSYTGNTPYFYWSRNEINVARIKKKRYFLYLVNRKNIDNEGYSPLIIQNPYQNVLMAEKNWEQRIEKVRISWKQGEINDVIE